MRYLSVNGGRQGVGCAQRLFIVLFQWQASYGGPVAGPTETRVNAAFKAPLCGHGHLTVRSGGGGAQKFRRARIRITPRKFVATPETGSCLMVLQTVVVIARWTKRTWSNGWPPAQLCEPSPISFNGVKRVVIAPSSPLHPIRAPER